MDMRLIKYILILCLGFICLFSTQASYAQPYAPDPNGELKGINGLADWTGEGQKKKQEEENKSKSTDNNQNTTPELLQRPSSYIDDLNQSTSWGQSGGGTSSNGKCPGAYQPTNQDSGTTPTASGLFSDEILSGMQQFMRDLYVTLAKPMMIGHSLMCYADKVAFHCVGIKGLICIVKLVNLNLFISGLIIYIVGVLMTISIGMYFVDISFKLGFAMLFMPISIALWPFPPTKNKFGENLSIIIRNGMLFALVAIGVTLATKLINSCLFPGNNFAEGEAGFWEAVANKRTEVLIANFAFDELHFLVMCFGLIFAFKILASSVNDYLDYFFSDSVFGSESPMHHMGTQAVGLLKANTVDRAASYAKDVAKTQAGRAIAGVGGGIVKLGSASGRKQLAGSIKSGASAVGRVVANPRQSYNAAMSRVGDTAEKVVSGIGSGVKGLVNAATFIAPTKESTRKKMEKWLDEKIDKGTQATGKFINKEISKGGGQLQNLAADAAASGINMYNRKIVGNKSAKTVTRDDVKKTVGESLDSVKDDVKTAANYTAAAAKAVGTGVKDAATDMVNKVEDAAKDAVSNVAARVYNDIQDLKGTPENSVDAEGMRMILSDDKKKLAKATKEAWQDADKAPVTLQPSALLKAPFKATKGVVKGTYKHLTSTESWLNDIDRLATGWEKFQKAKEDKVILKKTGQVILRTAARTVKGTEQDAKKLAEGTASIFGNMLKDFGNSLQQNGGKKNKGWTSWKDIHAAEERKKEASQSDRDYYSNLSDRYDNDK